VHEQNNTMARNETRMKVCPVCGRDFAWRRKWADCWEQVRYCSDRCRMRKQRRRGDGTGTEATAS